MMTKFIFFFLQLSYVYTQAITLSPPPLPQPLTLPPINPQYFSDYNSQNQTHYNPRSISTLTNIRIASPFYLVEVVGYNQNSSKLFSPPFQASNQSQTLQTIPSVNETTDSEGTLSPLSYESPSSPASREQMELIIENVKLGCQNYPDVQMWVRTVQSFCMVTGFGDVYIMPQNETKVCCDLVGRISICNCENVQVKLNQLTSKSFKVWKVWCDLRGYTCEDTEMLAQFTIENINNSTYQNWKNFPEYDGYMGSVVSPPSSPLGQQQSELNVSIYDKIYSNSNITMFALVFELVYSGVRDEAVSAFVVHDEILLNEKSSNFLSLEILQNLVQWHVVQMKIDPNKGWQNIRFKTLSGGELTIAKTAQKGLELYRGEQGNCSARVIDYQMFYDGTLFYVNQLLNCPSADELG